MIEICGKKYKAFYGIDGSGKVVAWSLNCKNHLKRLLEFHNLEASIVSSSLLDKKFQRYIELGKKPEIDVSIYKYSRVYRELLKLKRLISYRELSERLGISTIALVAALKHNPFIFFIPCHLVVKSSGEVGGFTPLSREDKKLFIEAYIKNYGCEKCDHLLPSAGKQELLGARRRGAGRAKGCDRCSKRNVREQRD
jgi:O6-methylguanine-DNA--protein-cysteine methyltransferase